MAPVPNDYEIEALTIGLSEVNKAAKVLGDKISDLDRRAHRQRMLILMTFISVSFDILLSIALGLLAFQANDTAAQARQAAAAAQSVRDAKKQQCEQINEVRRLAVAPWDELIGYSKEPPPPDSPTTTTTPQQKATLDKFLPFLDQLRAQQDCEHLS